MTPSTRPDGKKRNRRLDPSSLDEFNGRALGYTGPAGVVAVGLCSAALVGGAISSVPNLDERVPITDMRLETLEHGGTSTAISPINPGQSNTGAIGPSTGVTINPAVEHDVARPIKAVDGR